MTNELATLAIMLARQEMVVIQLRAENQVLKTALEEMQRTEE